jgi:chemotaxis protein methyltransferase CheR
MYLVKNRLAKRMSDLAIKTVRDYFYHVKYDVSQREFQQLVNLITTNETSFFRNEPQLQCFAEEVLPPLLDQKRRASSGRTIRIWSAGCSTGEEPYTLAMLCLEQLGHHSGVEVEIIANDISEDVLVRARQGRYSGLTLRNVSPDLLNRYFSRNGQMYDVRPEVKALVRFSHINLHDGRMISTLGSFDVIFCRNVMIYFSDDVKKELVRRFYAALHPGGHLFIGHSETLHGVSRSFRLEYFKSALVYRKEPDRTQQPGLAGQKAEPQRVSSGASLDEAVTGALRAMELLKQVKQSNAGATAGPTSTGKVS